MKATLFIVGLLVAACASAAQTASLPVLIEQLDAGATACGISESQLERVALRTLAGSRYQPDPDAGGRLRVRVSGARIYRNSCTARISVRMRASAKPRPPGGSPDPGKRPRDPAVVLCNDSGDYSAPKARFPLEVESSVEYSIRRCLGSLKY